MKLKQLLLIMYQGLSKPDMQEMKLRGLFFQRCDVQEINHKDEKAYVGDESMVN